MRKLMLALALLTGGLTGGAQALAQTNTGAIEGRILNAITQEPVPNVQVILVAPPPANPTANLAPDAAARLEQQVATLIESGIRAGASQDVIDNAVANMQRNAGGAVGAQTTIVADNEGRFIIKNLAPGRYTLRVTREGYFGPPANGIASAQVVKTVNVIAGSAAPVEFALTQGGIISGRVRDPNGQAVSGLQIAAYRVTYNNGRKVWAQANAKATDDRGEYRMFWLPPGEYYVGAIPRTPGTVPGPQDSWARTFFPGVTEPEAASLVSMPKGGELSGIDINIRSAPTSVFTISGTAKNPYAPAQAGRGGIIDQSISTFFLAPREFGLLDLSTPSVVNAVPNSPARANGAFEIRNVRPGSYDLIPYYLAPSGDRAAAAGGAPLPPPPPRQYLFSRNPVEVRNADVTGLALSVTPGFDLTGEVVVTGTSVQAIKRESVRLSLRTLSTMPPQLSTIVGALTPDTSGRFSATGIPADRYSFNITGLPEGAFVADIRQGAASVFDTGFVVDGNANPVQVVLEGGGVQLTGVVLNAERKPVSGATVVLVPPTPRRQNTLLYKNAQTDESGRFTLRSVPPGPYTIYAWESVLPTAWQNAEFMSRYEGRGRAVIVERPGPLQVEVQVIPVETSR